MTPRVIVLLTLSMMCLFEPALAETPKRGVTGSLFKLGVSESRPAPVVGASVYLHRADSASGADWIGPNLTDVFGRFNFPNVDSGKYLLRIYSGTIHLWEQTLAAPTIVEPIVIRDIVVIYHPKAADADRIDAILQRLALPYDHAPAQYPLATNMISFGDQVELSDVKLVANAMLKGGVAIRAIRRFEKGSDWWAKVIEIGSSPAHTTGQVLTVKEVTAASDFPRSN
jgi:hypothetical protein